MNKEKMIEEMKARGYEVIEDNHVITFKGEGYIEDLIPAIKDALNEIGYVGTWGVRAISKSPDKRAERVIDHTPAATEDNINEAYSTGGEESHENTELEQIAEKKEEREEKNEGVKPEIKDTSTKKEVKGPTGYTQMSLMDLFG